jgi:dUTP pyrophosphatase
MKVRIKKTDDRAHMPTYGSEYSAGADLYALLDEKLEIKPHETAFIRTGISLEIPEGYCGLIFARSSMGAKRGLAPANKVGVIDADYRGEVMVALHNHSEKLAEVEPGERVAQLAIVPFLKAEFEETEELSNTVRGAGGFGSTGK